MFERFSEKARRTMVFTTEQARSLRHNYQGTEHLLLALFQVHESTAAKALQALGVSEDTVRQRVLEIIGEGAQPESALGHIPWTPRAKKVLELALRESLQLKSEYIGPEHLLLAIARENEGVASQILDYLGATKARIRQTVFAFLGKDDLSIVTPDITFRLEPKLRRLAALRCQQLSRGFMFEKNHPLRILPGILRADTEPVSMNGEMARSVLIQLLALELPDRHPLLAVEDAIRRGRIEALQKL